MEVRQVRDHCQPNSEHYQGKAPRERDDPSRPMVFANRVRLKILLLSLLMFITGGVSGAIGFKHIGFTSTMPLAIVLIILASVAVIDDVVAQARAWRKRF